MSNAKHSEQTASDGIHICHAFEYADQAARTGATGLDADDVGKVAKQTDTLTWWVLTNHSPVTWKELTATVSAEGNVVAEVIKGSAGTISKGEAVYISGYNATEGCPEVEKAKADSSSTMPGFGVANENITDAAKGDVMLMGEVSGLDTSTPGWSVGDSLYVSKDTAGELVDGTKPTGATTLIQKMAQVTRVHVSLGTIQIFGAGRSNDVPNIATGYVWVGDASGNAYEEPLGHYVESNGESTTTSETYQQKTRLTFTPHEEAYYEVHFSALVVNSNANKAVKTRIQLDDTTTKKEASAAYVETYANGGYYPIAGYFVTQLSAASHDIDFDFASGEAGKTAYIKEAVLTARRIS